MTLIGSMGRWHGSIASATPDVLAMELANETRAIVRIQSVIAEHKRLLDAHRRVRRNLQRRLARRRVSE